MLSDSNYELAAVNMYSKCMLRARYLFMVIPGVLYWCVASNWWLLDIAGIGTDENFIDLSWFYSYVECVQSLSDILLFTSTGCSTANNYGPVTTILFWLIVKSGAPIYMVGIFMMVAITATLVYLCLKLGRSSLLARTYQLLLILCPGMILLFERGNLDGVIFLGLTIIIFGLYGKRPSLSLVLLVILSLIKFYTIFLVVFLILIEKSSRGKKLTKIIFSFSPVLFFAILIVDKIPYNWFLSFGSFMPLAYLDFALKEFGSTPKIIEFLIAQIEVRIFLGVIISFLIFMFFYRFVTIYKILIKETFEISSNSKITSSGDIYFIGVSIVFISCYFLSTNYDYRMVFLVPSLIMLDKKVSGKISQNFFLTFLAISTLWLGSVYSGPRYFLQAAQFLGDISANLIVGVLVVYIIGCPNLSVFSSLNRALRNR